MGSLPWGAIGQWVVWAIAMTLVVGWLERSRLQVRSDSDAGVMAQPRSIGLVGLMGGAFFGSLLVVSNTIGFNATTSAGTNAIFGIFILGSLWTLAEYYRAHHRVTESATLTGLAEFARLALANIPDQPIEAQARTLLEGAEH